ncbi:MAG: porin [Desulfobacterales bacterium]
MRFFTVLAVMAALFLGPMNVYAVTVYDRGGTRLDLKGDIQIQPRQNIGDDEDLYVDYDDLTVAFSGKQDLEAGLSAFGVLKMDWKGQAHGDDDNAVDEAFAGLRYDGFDFGSLSASIGRLAWGSDSFEVEEAYEMNGGMAFPESSGSDSMRVDVNSDFVNVALSGDLETDDWDSSCAEAFVYTDIKGLELGVLAQTYKENSEADSVETLGARVTYDFGFVYAGADYSTSDGGEYREKEGGEIREYNDVDYLNLVAVVPVFDNTKCAFGYGQESPDEGDDINSWYANVTHKLSGNVSTFAEIGDTDEDDADMGYLAGFRFKF